MRKSLLEGVAPISVRWAHINNRNDQRRGYRSRLAVRKVRKKKTKGPPLRPFVHINATVGHIQDVVGPSSWSSN